LGRGGGGGYSSIIPTGGRAFFVDMDLVAGGGEVSQARHHKMQRGSLAFPPDEDGKATAATTTTTTLSLNVAVSFATVATAADMLVYGGSQDHNGRGLTYKVPAKPISRGHNFSNLRFPR
jgi:hypothetical protein